MDPNLLFFVPLSSLGQLNSEPSACWELGSVEPALALEGHVEEWAVRPAPRCFIGAVASILERSDFCMHSISHP